jgi:redox-sensitive bicupin YhaK (pirin superfamily)
MGIQVFPPNQQGTGSFDNGKFIEQRPIGFPGDDSSIDRIGPLFYWAWGKASDIAEIGMHPHQAFEIMTYVIQGVVEHQDSLGSKQIVTTGGVQVMQAGSGIYHAEAFREIGSEGFQIWFEPYIRESIKQAPTYSQFDHDAFPIAIEHGVTVKTVLGAGSPIQLQTDAFMKDIMIPSGHSYLYPLNPERTLGFLTIAGDGTINLIHSRTQQPFQYKDFVIIRLDQQDEVTFSASQTDLRIVTIEVPAQVPYPLYRK